MHCTDICLNQQIKHRREPSPCNQPTHPNKVSPQHSPAAPHYCPIEQKPPWHGARKGNVEPTSLQQWCLPHHPNQMGRWFIYLSIYPIVLQYINYKTIAFKSPAHLQILKFDPNPLGAQSIPSFFRSIQHQEAEKSSWSAESPYVHPKTTFFWWDLVGFISEIHPTHPHLVSLCRAARARPASASMQKVRGATSQPDPSDSWVRK